MFNLVESYMNKLTKAQVNDFAIKNQVHLSNPELDFVYAYVIRNWRDILRNPNSLDLTMYKDKFSAENYNKVQTLLRDYLNKFSSYLIV